MRHAPTPADRIGPGNGSSRAGVATESVRPYADRGLVTRKQWNGIIHGATRELWLYGMAAYGYATDDAMLVTPYMRFFIGSNSPTFEFRAREAPKMFTRYTRHFESTWTNAEDWHP